METAASAGQPSTMARVPVAIELLTLGGFVFSAGFFTAALDDDAPPLDNKRWGCLAFSGAILSIALLARVDGWVLMFGGLALVANLAVVALAACAGRSRRQSRAVATDPEWWPRFERDFEAYVRLGSTEERRDDSPRTS